ncbi:MAG: STAS/SEC14 domain-containing protein [Polyangiaceae bacterium]
MKKPTQVTRTVGQMIIARQARDTPTEKEWDDFLQAVVENRDNTAAVRILVLTDGGGPSTGQRRRLQAALDGRIFRVAVVSDSIKVRFIVSSVALLNSEISSFTRAEIGQAYKYLRLTTEEQRLAIKALAEIELLIAP